MPAANVFNSDIIRRTVSVPRTADDLNVIALVNLGGKLFNRDLTYQLFFKFGAKKVYEFLKEEFIGRGGSLKEFEASYKEVLSTIADKE